MSSKPLLAALLVTALLGPTISAQSGKGMDDWLQYYGSADHNNFRKLKNQITCPKVLWHIPDLRGVPAVYDGAIYSSGKDLLKADLKTGEILASVAASDPPEDRIFYGGTPLVVGESIVAVKSTGTVEAHDLNLVEKRWSLELSEKSRGMWGYFAPAFSEGVIVLTGGDVVGVDAEKGEIKWLWSNALSGRAEMSAAVWQGKVIFGTDRGFLIALDLNSGETLWKQDCGVQFGWSNPVVVDGKIFLADRGSDERRGAINAFHAEDGKQLWSEEFGATGCSTPGVGPGVILAGFGRTVAVFDQKSGEVDRKKIFSTETNPFGSPTLVGDSLIFGNLDGNLYVFDFKKGDLKWRFAPQPKGEQKRVQVLDFAYLKRRILLVSTTRGLFAIGQDPRKKRCPSGFTLSD